MVVARQAGGDERARVRAVSGEEWARPGHAVAESLKTHAAVQIAEAGGVGIRRQLKVDAVADAAAGLGADGAVLGNVKA